MPPKGPGRGIAGFVPFRIDAPAVPPPVDLFPDVGWVHALAQLDVHQPADVQRVALGQRIGEAHGGSLDAHIIAAAKQDHVVPCGERIVQGTDD